MGQQAIDRMAPDFRVKDIITDALVSRTTISSYSYMVQNYMINIIGVGNRFVD